MDPEKIKERIRNGLSATDRRTMRRLVQMANTHKSRCDMLLRLHKRHVVKYGPDSDEVKAVEGELKMRELCIEQCTGYVKAVKYGLDKRAELDENP